MLLTFSFILCYLLSSLSDACDLTLDPNTAHTMILLSEENRKITYVFEYQQYPDHPERFEETWQVLSRESMTGRCYWEAEWYGYGARIAVSYKGIERKYDAWFGNDDKSWSLFYYEFSHLLHGDMHISIPHHTDRVGVYLDWSAGILSFYNISESDKLIHLHTFNETFTEPLYAGFTLYQSTVFLRQFKRQRQKLRSKYYV